MKVDGSDSESLISGVQIRTYVPSVQYCVLIKYGGEYQLSVGKCVSFGDGPLVSV